MNNKVWGYFDLAGKAATSKQDLRGFLLGAVAVRNDGALVSSVNSVAHEPNRLLHAEYRISSKIDKGSTVYVARIRLLNGEFACSKPCFSCEKVLRTRKVDRVYYTISNDEYGVLDFDR